MSLITWTAASANKLKEYELVTKGINIKLNLNSDNCIEWNESVATHVKQMDMLSLFTYSPTSTTVHRVYNLFIA